jgi:hypothetical protein
LFNFSGVTQFIKLAIMILSSILYLQQMIEPTLQQLEARLKPVDSTSSEGAERQEPWLDPSLKKGEI